MRINGTLATACFAFLLSLSAYGTNREVIQGGSAGSSGQGRSGSTSGGQCNINITEKKCVDNKNFGKEFAQTAYDNAKGQRPGGLCLRGVRESLQESCGKNSTSWGCAEAEDSTACFMKLGFTENKGKPKDGQEFRPGTVFVYAGDDKGGGPGAGHVEVFTGTQMNGQQTFCSDYCTNNRRDKQSPQARPILAWYEPPAEDSARVADLNILETRYSAIAFLFDAR